MSSPPTVPGLRAALKMVESESLPPQHSYNWGRGLCLAEQKMKTRVIRRVAGENDVVQTHAVVEQPGLHLVNLAHVALQQQLFTQAAAKAREALCLKGLSPEVQGLAETIVVAADYGVALEQALIELKELSERPSNPTRRIAASLHRRLARFRVRW